MIALTSETSVILSVSEGCGAQGNEDSSLTLRMTRAKKNDKARGMTVQARSLRTRRVLANACSTLNEYVGVKMQVSPHGGLTSGKICKYNIHTFEYINIISHSKGRM